MTQPAPAFDDSPIPPKNYERFMRLFDGNEDLLLRNIRRHVNDPNEADDVYQETMMVGMRDVHKMADEEFLPLLIGISRNIALARRKQQNRLLVHAPKISDRKPGMFENVTMRDNPVLQVLNAETLKSLSDGLAELDDDCAQIINLRYYEKWSIARIVLATGLTRGQVKGRIAKAKKALSAYMMRMFLGTAALEITHEHVMAVTQQGLDRIHAAYPELAALGTSVTAGTVTAGTAATETTGFSVSKMMTCVLAPLVWIVSLVTTGHFCGWSLVDAEPSPRIRRWLVKQLAFCYTGIFVLPQVAIVLIHLIFYALIGHDGLHWMIGTGAFLTFVLFVVYVVLIRLRYRHMIQADTNNTPGVFPSSHRLSILIQRIFIGTTVCFVFFMLWVVGFGAAPVVLYSYAHHEVGRAYSAITIVTTLALTIGILHLCSYIFFRYLASISRGYASTAAQPAQSPTVDAKASPWRSDRIATILFAIVTLLPILGQIHSKPNERLWLALEAVVVLLAWAGTYGNNMYNNLGRKQGWIRAVAFLLGVLALRLFMLLVVYD